MTIAAVVGLQWGDEGKGKIVDALGENVDVVVRCQGGANAGHTVVVGGDIFKLHLIPSGILRRSVVCVIGNGVVVDPAKFCAEIDELIGRGLDAGPERLLVSDRAHLNLPHHKALDGLREKARGKDVLGTTLQGIGPCYTDKARRVGLRCHHLRDLKAFRNLLRETVELANREIVSLGGEPLSPATVEAQTMPTAERLQAYVADTVAYLHQAREDKQHMLLEGAQGAMLDIDFGTYPYLTSSNTTSGGCVTGTGLPPTAIHEVHGVLKAFTTRVGAGPFPTEVEGEEALLLRGTGQNQWDEYGTTTGRPRRCGWLDLAVGRFAAQLNGVTRLHITKLDILGQFKELKLCTGYRLDGKAAAGFPAALEDLARCEPVYETLPGWRGQQIGGSSLDDLPEAARVYVHRIAEVLGAKIASVSFGPGRNQTIHCV